LAEQNGGKVGNFIKKRHFMYAEKNHKMFFKKIGRKSSKIMIATLAPNRYVHTTKLPTNVQELIDLIKNKAKTKAYR
jgi:hypothetical protein